MTIEKVEFTRGGGESKVGYLKLDHPSGEIEYSLTGEASEMWTVVFTDWGFSRAMFDNSTNEVECKTVQWEKNNQNCEGNKYGKCGTCRYSVWVDNKKPACQLRINLKGYIDGDVEKPVHLTLKGASYSAGADFLESTNGKYLFDSLYTISASELQKRGAVEYRLFKIKEAEKLDEKEIAKWKEIAEKDIEELNASREKAEMNSPATPEKAAEILEGELENADTPDFLKGA